jgi:hypothetical protein
MFHQLRFTGSPYYPTYPCPMPSVSLLIQVLHPLISFTFGIKDQTTTTKRDFVYISEKLLGR